VGGARVEVLSPDSAASNRDSNAQSLVMRITLGQRSFLLTGDIERRTERELVEHGQLARADVLKIAHHGSRTSTTEPFLDAARPAFAVISAGYQTPFRHPHEEVLERLRERRVAVFRTDLDGLVTVRTDGRRVDVLPARSERGSRGLRLALARWLMRPRAWNGAASPIRPRNQ
jgi:competence protein ComEC